MKRLIIWLTLFVLMASVATAIGVSPVKGELPFEPGTITTGSFKVINNEGKNMYFAVEVDGELEQFVIFDREEYLIPSTEKELEVTFNIVMPARFKTPGPVTSRIVIYETGPPGRDVQVKGAVIYKLTINVPFPGTFVNFLQDMFIVENIGHVDFVMPLQNLGTDSIDKLTGTLQISDADGTLASLDTDSIGLDSNEKGKIRARWTKYALGNFNADLRVLYNGKRATHSQKFTVGHPEIKVTDAYVESFKRGQIAKVLVEVENLWNDQVEGVSAMLTVLTNKTEIASFRTSDIDVGSREKGVLVGFWNTEGVTGSGAYDLKLDLTYTGGTTQITVPMRIKTAVKDVVVEPSYLPYIIAGAVVAIVLNAALMWLLLGRRKNRKKHHRAKK